MMNSLTAHLDAPRFAPRVDADLRLGSNIAVRTATWLLAIVAITAPLSIGDSYTLSLLAFAGITAIGATGLNLLMGYAGELSIGHAFFVSVGSYGAVVIGDRLGLPLIIWLLGCAVLGAVAGALVTPIAMRIRGPYLIVVTLGLVAAGQYLFLNWRSVSGGPGGTQARPNLSLGFMDFANLELFGVAFTRAQGLTVLVWIVLALVLLIVRNISRSRAGRAMRAARDNPLAAESLSVDLFRVKSGAFIVSSAITGIAGGLFAAQLQYILPETFDLLMSIQYIAILVVGGIAATYGPVLGAFVVGVLPQVLDRFAGWIPFVDRDPNAPGFGISVAEFTILTYGLVIVIFLIADPKGLNGLLATIRNGALRKLKQARTPSTGAADT